NFFYRGFNYGYERCEWVYTAMTRWVVRHNVLTMLVFAGLLGLTAWMFLALPTGFLPTEDQGYVIVSVQLPDAASKQRTDEEVACVNAIIGDTAGVADWLSIGGNNVFDGTVASNAAAFYVVFKDWEERNDPSLSQQAILEHLQQEFQKIEEAIVLVFP